MYHTVVCLGNWQFTRFVLIHCHSTFPSPAITSVDTWLVFIKFRFCKLCNHRTKLLRELNKTRASTEAPSADEEFALCPAPSSSSINFTFADSCLNPFFVPSCVLFYRSFTKIIKTAKNIECQPHLHRITRNYKRTDTLTLCLIHF